MPLSSIAQLTRQYLAEPSQSNISNGTAELLCLISLLALVGLVLWMVFRGKSSSESRANPPAPLARHNPSDPYAAIPTSQMESDANSALVAADDALRTSEQELALATAQYGAPATEDFSMSLDRSRGDVMEAFRLRQMLDDDISDDESTKRDWLRKIIERCQTADGRLDAQSNAFDRLRDIEARVEPMIDELTARREDAVARLPQMETTCRKLAERYAPSALLPISDSAAQFAERIKFADRSLASARAALDSGKRSQAALGVRAAEESLAQVDLLLVGVEALAGHLDEASASVQRQLSEVETDIAAGRAAAATAGAGSAAASAPAIDLAAAVAGAEKTAGAVRAEMAAAKPDPFASLRRLEEADQHLSTALANIRDVATRVDRARSMLASALPAARAEVRAAENFITTRRGAVRAEARTRLAAAQRRLDQADAVAETDPVAALGIAQEAESMASAASRLANHDVGEWSQPQVSGGAMGGFGGAVLGGILIDSMLAGRLRRGRGGFSGRLGGGFGWGGMLPGSFGGGGATMRVRI